MIQNNLNCHSTTRCPGIHSVHAEAELEQGCGLRLHFLLRGQLGQLRIPEAGPANRGDGLYRHTCFEAFIGVKGESSYYEFNFSPSGQWAAFAFQDYRSPDEKKFSQSIYCYASRSEKFLLLEALIPASDLPANLLNKPLQLGLNAVLEAENGHHSYWALHHPVAAPDFHHRSGFACTLKPGATELFPFSNKQTVPEPEPA